MNIKLRLPFVITRRDTLEEIAEAKKAALEAITSAQKQLKEDKDNQDEVITSLKRELDHWQRTFRKYSRIPCANCQKQMHVYPFGGAYYTHNGQKVHAHCYDEYLENNK